MISILVVEIYHIPTNRRVAMYPSTGQCSIEDLFLMAWTKAIFEGKIFPWENKKDFRCLVKEF